MNFSSKLTDFTLNEDGTLNLSILKDEQVTTYNTEVLILAIGHSARDTFKLLYDKGLKVEQKAFAMGVRIEHKREFINRGKYGDKPEYEKLLPTADYKFAHSCENGRSVYSFCMCPGGYVVNSSSESGRLCVNGMSYSDRMADNSNSAVVVNVTPEDFGSDHPLAGMYMQEHYEEMAYKAGIDKNKIMVDPGIGFGKTLEQNLIMMNNLELLKKWGLPILLGTSRKSMIGLTLDLPVNEREEGTITTSVIGLMKGCQFFRVHDVKANYRALKMAQAILTA